MLLNNVVPPNKQKDMQKDILFFSNYCEFCKEILSMLVKHSLKDAFMLVNVDKKTLKLPPFVDRVPLIYTVERKVFSDEHLVSYLQSKISSENLQPYALVGTNTGAYSENFSFLESGDSFPEDCARNYNYLGMEQRIYSPKEDDGPSKPQDNLLEKFMEDRNADIQKLFPNNNVNGFNRLPQ